MATVRPDDVSCSCYIPPKYFFFFFVLLKLGREKSPKGKKEEKGQKGKKGGQVQIDDEEDLLPRPPLEIHVSFKLHHWKTATDSLRTEQDGELPQSEV